MFTKEWIERMKASVDKEVKKQIAAFQKRLAANKLSKRDKAMIKKGS